MRFQTPANRQNAHVKNAEPLQGLLEAGEAASQAEIARREGISEMRVSQVLRLLRLAPEIREYILSMPETVHRPAVTERALRPILRIAAPREQEAAFRRLTRAPT